MAYARELKSGDGSTRDFVFGFPYLDKDHVKVYVDGTLTTEWSFLTTDTIRFNVAPASGSVIVITRATSPSARLVDYTSPSSLNEEDLDTDSLQAFYLAQEAADTVEANISLDYVSGQWEASGLQIKNLGSPTDPQDAVTKTWAETAMSSELSQAISARNAAQSAQAGAEEAEANTVAVLDTKADVGHTHPFNDVPGLQNALDSKLVAANNLSDIQSSETARANLGLSARGIAAYSPVLSGGDMNMLSSDPGSFFSSGPITEADAASWNLPQLGGSGTSPRWWNVITTGVTNRTTQYATEVYGIGTVKGRTFIRVKHDTWQPWFEIPRANHTHSIAQVNGLQDELDGKLNLIGGTITGDVTLADGTFYADNGSTSFLRARTRVLVGDAYDFEGNTRGNNLNTNFLLDPTIFDGAGTREWMLSNTYLSVIAESGGVPATFAGIADESNGRGNGYGSIHFVLNDTPISETGDSRAYAQYIEGVRSADCDTTRGFELNAVNLGPSPKATDPQPGLLPSRGGFQGMTVAAHIASGAGTGEFSTVYPSDAAIMIAPNASSFWTGISFLDGSLEPWGDARKRALLLKRLDKISWFDGNDNEVFDIDVTADGAANAVSMKVNNGGVSFLNELGHPFAFFGTGADGGEPDYPQQESTVGFGASINAAGPGTDIDLRAQPKGNGLFGVRRNSVTRKMMGPDYFEMQGANSASPADNVLSVMDFKTTEKSLSGLNYVGGVIDVLPELDGVTADIQAQISTACGQTSRGWLEVRLQVSVDGGSWTTIAQSANYVNRIVGTIEYGSVSVNARRVLDSSHRYRVAYLARQDAGAPEWGIDVTQKLAVHTY